jgi:hypothetical protein
MSDYAGLQAQIVGPVAVCPANRPYAVAGINCVACNTTNASYFNMSSQSCQGCGAGLYYDSVNRTCTTGINITNTAALVNYFGQGSSSLQNVTIALTALSQVRQTFTCPSSAPLALSNGSCVQCNGSNYVDLATMTCIPGVTISNFPLLRVSKVFQLGSANLTYLEAQQRTRANGVPVVYCPLSAPLFTGVQCLGCRLDQYYNLQSMNCYTPLLVSNVSALAASYRYI